jgi:hypothetical protein
MTAKAVNEGDGLAIPVNSCAGHSTELTQTGLAGSFAETPLAGLALTMLVPLVFLL